LLTAYRIVDKKSNRANANPTVDMAETSSCANCGKGEEFEAKLKACSACKLVKYCGRECQIAHRSSHKKGCKKRAAEHDEALFKQPPTGDDCPICFLLLPLESGHVFRACCGKTICTGCDVEHYLQSNGNPTCPFCRADMTCPEDFIEWMKTRVDGNDAQAVYHFGVYYLKGDEAFNIKKDNDKAIKLFHRAAELGSVPAYLNLGIIYQFGMDVVENKAKAKQYFELAAMAGNAYARDILGRLDADAGSFDRAIKHWLIAASCGSVEAVDFIKVLMTDGNATKDNYAQALRGYTQYLDEIRSGQRDRAVTFNEKLKYF
jgi:TPR repeat protein